MTLYYETLLMDGVVEQTNGIKKLLELLLGKLPLKLFWILGRDNSAHSLFLCERQSS